MADAAAVTNTPPPVAHDTVHCSTSADDARNTSAYPPSVSSCRRPAACAWLLELQVLLCCGWVGLSPYRSSASPAASPPPPTMRKATNTTEGAAGKAAAPVSDEKSAPPALPRAAEGTSAVSLAHRPGQAAGGCATSAEADPSDTLKAEARTLSACAPAAGCCTSITRTDPCPSRRRRIGEAPAAARSVMGRRSTTACASMYSPLKSRTAPSGAESTAEESVPAPGKTTTDPSCCVSTCGSTPCADRRARLPDTARRRSSPSSPPDGTGLLPAWILVSSASGGAGLFPRQSALLARGSSTPLNGKPHLSPTAWHTPTAPLLLPSGPN
eukprot:scaffold3854_cov107-Isochrysis_galbana.AAC.15